jgi:hypothetical protein
MGCGEVTMGPVDACRFSSECTITGTQYRTLTTRTCGGGSCASLTSMMPQACSREDTMGDACGTPTYGAWGTCTFLGCDPDSGSRFRSLTSACTTTQTCDPSGSGFELGTCSGSVVGSFCTPAGGGFGTCSGPGTCVAGII